MINGNGDKDPGIVAFEEAIEALEKGLEGTNPFIKLIYEESARPYKEALRKLKENPDLEPDEAFKSSLRTNKQALTETTQIPIEQFHPAADYVLQTSPHLEQLNKVMGNYGQDVFLSGVIAGFQWCNYLRNTQEVPGAPE